jgi:acyl dehydratase
MTDGTTAGRGGDPSPDAVVDVVVQRGLYLDELRLGTRYVHRPARTVTETDNVLFTTLTGNTQALHLDEEWSRGTEFGGRLVNSMFTLALVVGLSVTQLTQGTIVANLGFEEVRFPAPVRAGDTITAETVVRSTRPSRSRPAQGVAVLEHTGRNQRGEVVVVAVRSVLMHRAPGA